MAKTRKIELEQLLEEREQDVPEIPAEYFEAFEAWLYLARFRQNNGMAVSPLSFADCRHYAIELGVPSTYRLWFCDQVITIDWAWIIIQREKK